MPLDVKPRQGKPRSKSRLHREARSKLTVAPARGRDESPGVVEMSQGPPSSDDGNKNPDAPRPGFRMSASQCLQYLWAQRYLGLLLLLLWTLVILCFLVNTDSPSSKAKLPWLAEAAELGPQWENMLGYFFPTTCIVRDNQKIVACNNQPGLSKSECLKFKCCVSTFGTKIGCYAPLRDKSTQMLRVFGLAMISMIILGLLPMYCGSFCGRRKKMNRMVTVLKKQRTKMKKEPKRRKTSEERALLST
ncbi:fragile X mental retardation 1 neighbor protein [Mastomys coucha]|uniref:fragile X mental retardation 1 neighbor protein n=1 Tax=Mastomys coucha TaxID=35658 RepID=UPI0012615CCA|nr:fragile X mental retardation 1 neighbor protein [Mastomys coucha]